MSKILVDRIEKRLSAMGMSARAASLAAGGSADLIRSLKNGSTRSPRAETLIRLAEVLGTTPDWLLGTDGAPEPEKRQTMDRPISGRSFTRQLPIHGLAAGSFTGSLSMTTDPVEWVQCPSGLAQVKDAYGLIVTGSSMEPAFFPGDYVFINPNRPPRQGDHVVVQEAREGGTVTSIARFEKQTETHLILSKYNPLSQIQVDRKIVMAVHRVMTMREIVGG